MTRRTFLLAEGNWTRKAMCIFCTFLFLGCEFHLAMRRVKDAAPYQAVTHDPAMAG